MGYGVPGSNLAKQHDVFLQVVHRLTAKINEVYQCGMPLPLVTYQEVDLTAAGAAFPHQNRININPKIVESHTEFIVVDTIPHELAHLADHKINGCSNHGKNWRNIMKSIGVTNPSANHELEVLRQYQKKKNNTFEYRCECQSHEVGFRQHREIQAELKKSKDRFKYSCPECCAEVVWNKIEVVIPERGNRPISQFVEQIVISNPLVNRIQLFDTITEYDTSLSRTTIQGYLRKYKR